MCAKERYETLGSPFLLYSQTHYQTPFVLRYSPHIKRRTTTKPLKAG